MVSYILETFWSGVQGYQRRGLHGLRTVERSVENRELSRETLPKVQWIRRVCSPWTFAAPGCLVLSDVSPSSFSICSGKQIGQRSWSRAGDLVESRQGDWEHALESTDGRDNGRIGVPEMGGHWLMGRKYRGGELLCEGSDGWETWAVGIVATNGLFKCKASEEEQFSLMPLPSTERRHESLKR